MFSKPQPLAITLFFFYPELTHVSVSQSGLELRKWERCGVFPSSTPASLCSVRSPWVWVSRADGVMIVQPPFLSLKEVPSRHVSSLFMCPCSLASKLTTFLLMKVHSYSRSIKMSLFIFHLLSHSNSSEGESQCQSSLSHLLDLISRDWKLQIFTSIEFSYMLAQREGF